MNLLAFFRSFAFRASCNARGALGGFGSGALVLELTALDLDEIEIVSATCPSSACENEDLTTRGDRMLMTRVMLVTIVK
jgi:hypothetical protein